MESGNINMGDLFSISCCLRTLVVLTPGPQALTLFLEAQATHQKVTRLLFYGPCPPYYTFSSLSSVSHIGFDPSQQLMSHKISHWFLAFF